MSSRSERGQATIEWVALIAVLALVLAGLVTAGVRVPGTALAEEVADQIACAVRLGSGCGGPGELTIAYGSEVGGLVAEHAPLLAYERGMRSLPVDFRQCAELACADSGSADAA